MRITNYKLQITNFFRHPLFSGSLLMIGGSMVVNGINYFYHLIMGRMLGPIDYGILVSLYSILYIVSIVPTSTSIAITKFVSSAKDEHETKVIYQALSKFIFYTALVLSSAMLIFSYPISSFLHIENIFTVILIAPTLFLLLITLVNQATAQGLLEFLGSVWPNLVSSIAKLAAGIVLILIGWAVFGAMVGVILSALLAYLSSLRFVNKLSLGVIKEKYDLKPFIKYSFPVLVQALSFTALFTTDVILVKHFLPSFEAGLYAALSMLGKTIYFAAAPIAGVMFPIVSKRRAANEKYLKVFSASFLLTAFLSLSILIFYFFFPNLAIGILYGEAYLSAQAQLVWMGAFLLFYTLSYLLVNFMLSLGRTKVVILPLLAAFSQILLIWIMHESILRVIQISLSVSFLLFLGLLALLIYNLRTDGYEQK